MAAVVGAEGVWPERLPWRRRYIVTGLGGAEVAGLSGVPGLPVRGHLRLTRIGAAGARPVLARSFGDVHKERADAQRRAYPLRLILSNLSLR